MKSEKTNEKKIAERSVAYALRVIKLYRELEKDRVGQVLGNQLLRSGTSIGANIHEAQGSQSKAEFVAKMSIAHREARESAYWLRLIRETRLVAADRLTSLSDETDQFIKILSSILLTSKQHLRREKNEK